MLPAGTRSASCAKIRTDVQGWEWSLSVEKLNTVSGFTIGMNKSLEASPFLILVIEMVLLQEFIIAVDFFT